MTGPREALSRWASRRRFPTLLGLVAALFVIDLLVPDAIPFVDEILLGLTTALLAAWKRRGDEPEPDANDAGVDSGAR